MVGLTKVTETLLGQAVQMMADGMTLLVIVRGVSHHQSFIFQILKLHKETK